MTSKKLTMLCLSVLVITGFAVSTASAKSWKRNHSATGVYGGKWNKSVTRECSGGACTRHKSRTYTTPSGRTYNRDSRITTDGHGNWSRSGTASGPYGSATFGGSGHCSSGSCKYEGGRSGPRGNSSWSGRFERY